MTSKIQQLARDCFKEREMLVQTNLTELSSEQNYHRVGAAYMRSHPGMANHEEIEFYRRVLDAAREEHYMQLVIYEKARERLIVGFQDAEHANFDDERLVELQKLARLIRKRRMFFMPVRKLRLLFGKLVLEYGKAQGWSRKKWETS